MSRFSTPLIAVLTLVCGMLLGLSLGRGTSTLSAQSPPPSGNVTKPPASVAAPATTTQPRPASEDAAYDELGRQYAQFEPINRTFELVARTVAPAVVHIVAEKSGRIDESARMRHYEETGSGVIIRAERSPNLYVLTNNHVVVGAAAAKISIYLHDGRSLHPTQLWLDSKADIAVLDLNREDLPAARLGDSDAINVGNWVLAMGSPFGLTHSVSQGIISARGRHMDELQDVENQDFLQTDAAINPGNSGGPLVNMKGEVVGINNSIASNGGGNEGVGFSIPINLARWIMGQLVSKGRVSRGALGIDLHPEFRPEDAVALGLKHPRGAWVDVVHPTSPAAQGGLRDGDVILKFRSVDVHDLNHLINMVSMSPIGQPVELTVWRDRQSLTLKVTVGDRDRTIAATPASDRIPPQRGGLLRRPDRPNAPTPSALGMEVQTMDATVAREHGLPNTLQGALILKVEPTSPLSSIVAPMDVIYSVNGHGVSTAEEAVQALSGHGNGQGLLVGYDRVVKGVVERRSVQIP